MSPRRKHIHKYFRAVTEKNKVVMWRCAAPTCAHYVFTPLVLGRRSICWNCEDEFTLPDAEYKLLSKPVCYNCQEERRKRLDPILVDMIRGGEISTYEELPEELRAQTDEDEVTALLKKTFEEINQLK